MSTTNDKTTVELFVNGTQAEEALTKLKQRAVDLDAAINTVGKDPKELKKLQRELKQTEKEIARVESAGKGTRMVLENLDNTNLHGLRNALKYLKKELAATKPNTEEWKAYAEQIREVRTRINELEDISEPNKPLFDRMGDWAMKVWPLLDLAKQGIGYAEQFVEAFASMDSEMAGVRKFTGMTAEDVEALNEEFKKMDTRTSREALNQLAQEAGRLGKTSQEDVLGFVRAADQINVALDDLGDGATLTLSKLTGIFGDEAKYGTEKSLLKVGSVINELSQNCAASAPYLAEFASRMGGVGAQANMTIPQIMAYGAVLDSAGMNVEASSTALSQVIVRFMQEPAKYAKVAGMDVKKFSDMLKTDVNGAVIMFLDTLKSAGKIDTLAPMFKDMGENGSQAIATLSTLVANIDQVKAQQAVATQAFQDGISVTNEYNVQNTTAAAQLDKAKKSAHDFAVDLGQQLMPVMTGVLNLTNLGMQVLSTTIKFVYNHKAAIAALTAAIVSHIAIMKLHALWMNSVAIKTVVADKATKALAVSQRALSGVFAVVRLGAAALTNGFLYLKNGLTVTHEMSERWRKSMQAMSFSSWAGLILALGTALALLWRHFKKVSEEAQVVEKIRKDATSKMAEERVAIDLLVKAAANEKISLDERNEAITKLNALIPNYNAQLDATTGKYKANATALDDYLKKLTKKYELEGAKEQLKEIGKEKANATSELADAQKNYDNIKNAPIPMSFGTSSAGTVQNTGLEQLNQAGWRLNAARTRLQDVIKREKRILDAYGSDLEKDAVRNTEIPVVVPENNTTTPVTPSSGYTSQIVARKEKAKQEAAKRRAEAKAKKEFKADLEAVTAAKISGETSLRKDMEEGNIDYEKALERRHEIETTFYDQALSVYEKHMKGKAGMMLEEDKEYQDLLLKKQKSDEDYEKRKRDLEIQGIKRRALDEENAVRFHYEKAGESASKVKSKCRRNSSPSAPEPCRSRRSSTPKALRSAPTSI